jgi:hypothetical protein
LTPSAAGKSWQTWVAAWPPERIVATFNSLPGVAPVKRFKTSNVAATKIRDRIRDLGEAAQPEPEAEKPAAAKTAKPKGGKKAKGGAQSVKGKSGKKAASAKAAPKAKKAAKAQESDGPRERSKTAQVIAMLQRKGGASISEIMKTMGWQRHTVRGFMAGAMKMAGFAVESFKPDGGSAATAFPSRICPPPPTRPPRFGLAGFFVWLPIIALPFGRT